MNEQFMTLTPAVMRVGSLFSGVGGFDLGLERAGMTVAWQCEIDRHARMVLRLHWPDTQIHADVREVNGATLPPVDVLCFGSPCQDLSVAGKRSGLDGERSGLFFEAMRIVDEMGSIPRIAIWENVPGALSSNRGEDFAAILTEMGKRWSGVAYRVLDAQFFGVAQRRRRVFVVGHSGGWQRAAEILSLGQSLRGHSPARREAGEDITQSLTRCLGAGGADDNRAQGGFYVPAQATAIRSRMSKGSPDSDCTETLLAFGGNNSSGPIEVAAALNACATASGRQDFSVETFITASAHSKKHGHAISTQQAAECGHLLSDTTQITSKSNYSHPKPGDPCHPLAAGAHAPALVIKPCAFKTDQDPEAHGSTCPTLQQPSPSGGGQQHAVLTASMVVRRLTPTECCRLMGWPDDWNAWGVDEKGKRVEMSDSARYRQCGNGVVANVAEWIGRRIIATTQGLKGEK